MPGVSANDPEDTYLFNIVSSCVGVIAPKYRNAAISIDMWFMKKITIKSSKLKEKVCEKCKSQKSCGDLPGFCVLIYSVPIVLVVVGLAYLLITMNL